MKLTQYLGEGCYQYPCGLLLQQGAESGLLSKASGIIDKDRHTSHAGQAFKRGAALAEFWAIPFNERGLGYPRKLFRMLKVRIALEDKKEC